MMADRKLVILQGLNLSELKQSEFQEFCRVLETLEDYDYNTLIITATPIAKMPYIVYVP